MRSHRASRASLHARPITLLLALAMVLLGSAPAGAATQAPRVGADGVWPLSPAPAVVAGFFPPPARWAAGHRGVDLLGTGGQQVLAALPGTVRFAGVVAGRGVVVVEHGGFRTTYEPVAASTRVGDAIGAGEPIGRLERFGSHCPPRACLHWGLVVGEEYQDPLGLVGLAPVRLLPLSTVGPLPPARPAAGALRRSLALPPTRTDGSGALGRASALPTGRTDGSGALGRAPALPPTRTDGFGGLWRWSGARMGLAVGLP